MLTLIGTLAGVTITAVVGLLTAAMTNRWQYRRTEQAHRFEVDQQVRKARHESYARLIVAAQDLFTVAMRHHQTNREHPMDPAKFARQVPPDLDAADTAFEICRVEALLLATEEVSRALDAYSLWIRAFWPEAASGTSVDLLDDQDDETPYPRLIRSMQRELTAQISPVDR